MEYIPREEDTVIENNLLKGMENIDLHDTSNKLNSLQRPRLLSQRPVAKNDLELIYRAGGFSNHYARKRAIQEALDSLNLGAL